MRARPYCVVMALVLLAEVSRLGEGASNPGFVARITRHGLTYAREYGIAILKNKLSTIGMPDISGSFKASWMGNVSYEFTSLRINNFKIRNSDLSLHPGQGVRASLSNNYVSLSGSWKVKKAFITLKGSFDVNADGISIFISLNLGKDNSGRPTVSVGHCNNSIGHISVHISGTLSWILNLFHERIKDYVKNVFSQKICEIIRKSSNSYLEPYLRSLPVTMRIDQVAGIDYSLVGAPQATSTFLDTPFKGEFFDLRQRSPVPCDAPPIRLPQEDDQMIYFAISEHVFNTASWVYHQAGLMKFTIRNEQIQNLMKLVNRQSTSEWNPTSESTAFSYISSSLLPLLRKIPLDFPIHLHTKAFEAVFPQLNESYPNMELELEMSLESAPFLTFTPGNVAFMPVMNVQVFVLLPNSSDRKLLFQLRARTNISATINVSSSRINGSLRPRSKLQLELIHSDIRFFSLESMETILNHYATYFIYPLVNAKLKKAFPLPLARDTHLNSLTLQIHKNFLLLGAKID